MEKKSTMSMNDGWVVCEPNMYTGTHSRIFDRNHQRKLSLEEIRTVKGISDKAGLNTEAPVLFAEQLLLFKLLNYNLEVYEMVAEYITEDYDNRINRAIMNPSLRQKLDEYSSLPSSERIYFRWWLEANSIEW